MYSPADLPSRLRAAPAKKRRLSATTGSSSSSVVWYGLPTFSDSMRASSSAFSSIASAIRRSASARSPGVVSKAQSWKALPAAATAAFTSSSPDTGASAISSSVAGLRIFSVSPLEGSRSSPPMKLRIFVPSIVAMSLLCSLLYGGEVHADGLGHGGVGHAAAYHVDAHAQPGVARDGRGHALGGDVEHERQRRVGQRVGGGDRDGARHVGHAVVGDAVDLVGRVRVRGGTRGLEAAPLVDGHVDQHRLLLHQPQPL